MLNVFALLYYTGKSNATPKPICMHQPTSRSNTICTMHVDYTARNEKQTLKEFNLKVKYN